ncbi:MAG: glycoside hydrolase family 76 protein [Lapillicoccus sp.]
MGDPGLDARAAEAERSVSSFFGSRLLGMPGTHLARVEHPRRGRADAHWNYWWQAHYLDCVVDAGLRALRLGDAEGAAARARRGDRLVATIRLRNVGRFPNAFYDDMAWLVLAAGRLAVLHAALGRGRPPRRLGVSERVLTARLRSALTDDLGGGVFWNTRRDFKNVPASGPVALHLARIGDVGTARSLVEWMYARLLDQGSGLFLDGVRVVGGAEVVVRDVYTYNQGTVLGALVTLGDPQSLARASDLVAAVDQGLTAGDRRALVTHGGHDGGLFTGILARYLSLASADPAVTAATAATARRLVSATADGFWAGRAPSAEGTRFSTDPIEEATAEGRLELSTQLQAWMTLEAAAALG